MASSFTARSTVEKRFLRNQIRHVDTHNRVQEEREMWRQRKLELQSHLERMHSKRRRSSPITRGRLLSDTLADEREEQESPHSTYWTRRLMKAEENDPDRWGHSGYKELYPEEFLSTESESEQLDSVGTKKRKKKSKGDLLRKRTKKEEKRKKMKKKRLSTSTSSGGSDNEKELKRRRKLKKKTNK